MCAASHDATSFSHQQLGVLKVFARLIANQFEHSETVVELSDLAPAFPRASCEGQLPTGIAGTGRELALRR